MQSAATWKDLVARLKAYADGFRSHMPKMPNGKDTQKAVFVLVCSGNDFFIGKTRNTIAKLTPAMLQTAQDLMNLGDYLPGQLVILGPGDSNLWAVNEGDFDGLAKEMLRPTVERGIPVINPANAYRLLHKRDDWHFSKHGNNPEILGQVCIHAINVSQADYVLQCMLHNLFNRAFGGAKPVGAESSGAGKLPTIERLVSPRADPAKGKVVSKKGEIGVDLDSEDDDDEADKRHDSKLMELANAPIGLK